jgi:hypothetical protein
MYGFSAVGRGHSDLANSADGVTNFIDNIRRVAAVGEKVIVSNADWGGSVGKIEQNWVPGKSFAKAAPTEQPLMTQIGKTADMAVRIALKRNDAHTMGLVLKHINNEQYVATQARMSAPSSWNLESFFPSGADNQLKLPAGFVLEGFYYGSRPDPSRFSRKQPWLYQNFFTPGELALAIASYAKASALQPGRPLSLYMQAMDAAFLKYNFSDADHSNRPWVVLPQ